MTLQHSARFRAGLPLAGLVDDEPTPEILAEAAIRAAETLARCKAEQAPTEVERDEELKQRQQILIMSYREIYDELEAIGEKLRFKTAAERQTIMTGKDFARME